MPDGSPAPPEPGRADQAPSGRSIRRRAARGDAVEQVRLGHDDLLEAEEAQDLDHRTGPADDHLGPLRRQTGVVDPIGQRFGDERPVHVLRRRPAEHEAVDESPVVGGEAELDRGERAERAGQPQPGPHLAEVVHPAPHVVEVGLHDREARHQLLGPGRIVVHPVLGQAGRAELGRALVVLGGELAGAAAQVDDDEGPSAGSRRRGRPAKASRASSSPPRTRGVAPSTSAARSRNAARRWPGAGRRWRRPTAGCARPRGRPAAPPGRRGRPASPPTGRGRACRSSRGRRPGRSRRPGAPARRARR